MIEEKDIKVGNIVYLREKISYSSEDSELWKHISPNLTYLSEIPSKVNFEILEEKGGGVYIKPLSKILMTNHEEFGEIWFCRDVFKNDFSLYLSEGTEELCEYINVQREKLRAKTENKGEYPSDKLIDIIEDLKTAKFVLFWLYDIISKKKALEETGGVPIDEFNDDTMNCMLNLIVECLQKEGGK